MLCNRYVKYTRAQARANALRCLQLSVEGKRSTHGFYAEGYFGLLRILILTVCDYEHSTLSSFSKLFD